MSEGHRMPFHGPTCRPGNQSGARRSGELQLIHGITNATSSPGQVVKALLSFTSSGQSSQGGEDGEAGERSCRRHARPPPPLS